MQRDCPICGLVYEADPVRLRHGRQTTCSRACSYKLRAASKSNSCALKCSTCGNQFNRPPSQVKSKHKGVYCSRECHYEGRRSGLTKRVVSNPYRITSEIDRSAAALRAWQTRRENGTDRHSEATRERLRLATALQIARSKDRQVSNVEKKVAEALSVIGVGFRAQVPIRDPDNGRFVGLPDFILDDGSVLEVNGTFWHADPRFFPSGPTFPSQKRTAERYERKIAAFRRLGIEFYEVWESDVSQDAVDAVRAAIGRG